LRSPGSSAAILSLSQRNSDDFGDDSVIKIIVVMVKARVIPRVLNRPSSTLHSFYRGAAHRIVLEPREPAGAKNTREFRADLAGDGKVAQETGAGMSKETVGKVPQAAERIPSDNECSKFRFNYRAFLRSA